MTVLYDEGPRDPLRFSAQRDWSLPTGGVEPVFALSTGGSESERQLAPNVIEGETDVKITLDVRTSSVPIRETVTIAMLGGVVLTLDEAGLHWPWRGLDFQTVDRIDGFLWEPETWHTIEVFGKMRREPVGSLELLVDGLPVGQVSAVATWSLDNPRSWTAGVTNIRDEIAAGQFVVEFSRLEIEETARA